MNWTIILLTSRDSSEWVIDTWVHFKVTVLVKYIYQLKIYPSAFELFFHSLLDFLHTFGTEKSYLGGNNPLKFLSTVKGWRVSYGDAPGRVGEHFSWRTFRTRIGRSRQSSSSRNCQNLNGRSRRSSSYWSR